ncbi:transcriptional regulator [Halobacteriales archaeon SW_7_68_16]|nr:MAG: transcriptional regulator [Halobacteriales archaeon SW_7_68_16]
MTGGDGADDTAGIAAAQPGAASERGSFDESDHGRFTEWLRERSEPDWTAATEHRFTAELADDTVDDEVFGRYIVADYRFVETLTSTVGYAAAQAPTVDAKARLAGFLETVTTDETDYFERSFDALGVPDSERGDAPQRAVTREFDDLLRRASHEGGYAETLAVFVPAEWIYLTWATRASEGDRPDRFYLDEWIDLHAVEAFETFVTWLQAELDAVGPTLSARRQRRVAHLFERTVELEVAFFDAAYHAESA